MVRQWWLRKINQIEEIEHGHHGEDSVVKLSNSLLLECVTDPIIPIQSSTT